MRKGSIAVVLWVAAALFAAFGPVPLGHAQTAPPAGGGQAPPSTTATTRFLPLGTDARPAPPAELGDAERVAGLAAAVGSDEAALAALSPSITPGTRAFGFLLVGCQETGAVLVVERDRIDAELVGTATLCYLPEYFLATFEVPADAVPEGAVLGRG